MATVRSGVRRETSITGPFLIIGDLDIVVGDYNRLSYVENIGNVTVPEFVWFPPGQKGDPFDGMTFGEAMNPFLLDLDGDGDLDLAAGD